MDSIEVIIAIAAILFFSFKAVAKAFKIDINTNSQKPKENKVNVEKEAVIGTFEEEIAENKVKKNKYENLEIKNKKPLLKEIHTTKKNNTSVILTQLNNKTEAKKAFIYSEIFKRKY